MSPHYIIAIDAYMHIQYLIEMDSATTDRRPARVFDNLPKEIEDILAELFSFVVVVSTMCIVHQTYLRQLWYNYEKTPGLPLPILSGEFRNDRRMLYVIANFAPNTTVSSFFFFEDA